MLNGFLHSLTSLKKTTTTTTTTTRRKHHHHRFFRTRWFRLVFDGVKAFSSSSSFIFVCVFFISERVIAPKKNKPTGRGRSRGRWKTTTTTTITRFSWTRRDFGSITATRRIRWPCIKRLNDSAFRMRTLF